MAPYPISVTIDTTAVPTPSSETYAYSPQDAAPLNQQPVSSSRGVGIAIGIAILVCVLVLFSTVLFVCLRRRQQSQRARTAEERLIRRSQIEDAPPPYWRHSRTDTAHKGEGSSVSDSWVTLPASVYHPGAR